MKKILMVGCTLLLTSLSGCYAYAPAPAPVYAAAPPPGYYAPPQPAPYYYPAYGYAGPAVYPTVAIGVGGGYYGRCCWRR